MSQDVQLVWAATAPGLSSSRPPFPPPLRAPPTKAPNEAIDVSSVISSPLRSRAPPAIMTGQAPDQSNKVYPSHFVASSPPSANPLWSNAANGNKAQQQHRGSTQDPRLSDPLNPPTSATLDPWTSIQKPQDRAKEARARKVTEEHEKLKRVKTPASDRLQRKGPSTPSTTTATEEPNGLRKRKAGASEADPPRSTKQLAQEKRTPETRTQLQFTRTPGNRGGAPSSSSTAPRVNSQSNQRREPFSYAEECYRRKRESREEQNSNAGQRLRRWP